MVKYWPGGWWFNNSIKTESSFSRPNTCIGCSKNSNNGHRATRDFFPLFYTRYSKSEHTAQLCHNLVTTLSQGCHKVVTVSITKLFQACHKVATRLLWQPCGNLVTTLSFLYGLCFNLMCGNIHEGGMGCTTDATVTSLIIHEFTVHTLFQFYNLSIKYLDLV